jgi:PAT family beta-lactamase induction signal transducer AmpG
MLWRCTPRARRPGTACRCRHNRRAVTPPPPPSNPPPSPWRWIPTLYFAQGLPYVVVMTLAVVLYKNLGVSNTRSRCYTSWLYLPWVIKPLWSPVVDLLSTKRHWVVVLQFFVGAALAGVALALPGPKFLQMTLAVFWLMAFASATHDIAADGFYMLALPQKTAGRVCGRAQHLLPPGDDRRPRRAGLPGGLAGRAHGSVVAAWQTVFWLLAGLFVAPAPTTCGPCPARRRTCAVPRTQHFWADFVRVFAAFFSQPDICASWPSCCCTALPRRSCSSWSRPSCWTRARSAAWA